MRHALIALIRRDLKLATRIGGGFSLGLVFYLALVAILPFAVGPDLNLLSRIGPAILWIGALLATLIGLDRLFQADEEDGSLDLIRMSQAPLEAIVAAKSLAHWLTSGLPLTVAAPLFGLMLGMEPAALAGTAASLVPGTLALTFTGAIGAALTASLRRGGMLLSILVVPLMVPTLIFGVATAEAARGGTLSFATPFLALCALALAAIVAGSIAAAAALRARS
ncbi:heme exporter protein B [Rhizobiales bacterium GAS191]|jgi:heme exporter protein B|nr:heme exporter protein B [Rhizobiales bacterium GAS113]SEB77218.1 heme exporter protein B [Rhizobiales bacterium GAS188]SED50461.1 heme exporter protein B [Rhizobiales bacterium GAS191]